eukprot:3778336-Prymnesium_polylepis.1
MPVDHTPPTPHPAGDVARAHAAPKVAIACARASARAARAATAEARWGDAHLFALLLPVWRRLVRLALRAPP